MKSVKKRKENTTAFNTKYIKKKKKKTIKLKRRKTQTYKKSKIEKKQKQKKQKGGDTPMPKIIKDINFFKKDDIKIYGDIEQYLNPIYGVIMCESGYIENNYYIAKQREDCKKRKEEFLKKKVKEASLQASPQASRQAEEEEEEKKEEQQIKKDEKRSDDDDDDNKLTPEMEFIYKISTVVLPNVKPTKDVIEYINPYIIGRYIAILFFYNKTSNDELHELLIKTLIHEQQLQAPEKSDVEFRRVFGLLTSTNATKKEKTSKEIFHILLYCLWWISDNIEGIKNYYRGINETFKQINTKEITPLNYSKNDIGRVIDELFPNERKNHLTKSLADEEDKEQKGAIISELKKIKSDEAHHADKIVRLVELLNKTKVAKDDSERKISVDIDDKDMAIITKLNEDVKKDISTKLSGIADFPIITIKELPLEEKKDEEPDKTSFEYVVGDLLYKPIKVLNYRNAKLFHETSGKFLSKYPDCVETTMRNFINFLLFDFKSNKFIIGEKFKKINPKTVEYYEKFDSYDLQLSDIKQEIYGLELNARDAWTYLIVHHANSNIHFKSKIGQQSYEVCSGVMSLDKTQTNFIQLLQNLTSPDMFNSDNIKVILPSLNNLIKSDDDDDDDGNEAFKNGVGIVSINYEIDPELKYTIKFDLRLRHSFVTIKRQGEKEEVELGVHSENEYMHYLLGNVVKYRTDKNYLWFKYTDETLNDIYIRTASYNILELLSSDLVNKDIRNRITLNARKLTKDFLKYGNNVDDFIYSSNDFSFVDEIPYLTSLNHMFERSYVTTLPELTPLKKLTSIGNEFARGCNVRTIDLTQLINLTKIGDGFAEHCGELETIKLSNLIGLNTIGNNFAKYCYKLKTIGLSKLSELESIGNHFAEDCEKLETIDLSDMPKLKKIGNDFASSCSMLKTINVNNLENLKEIGNNFAKRSRLVEKININSLVNLESIGDVFYYGNPTLKTIDLTNLKKLKTIGMWFAASCDNLTTVELTGLSELESIGKNFSYDCIKLATIKLINLSVLKTIGKGFAAHCDNLNKSELKGDISNLSNLENKSEIITSLH